jgi:photosystem II stability/assembly factor-like uncharacterized protein
MRPLPLLAVCCVLALLPARPAAANGAFPDSDAILLPAGAPQQIILSTNFGLIISDDGGATWQWTCERPETSQGTLYSAGPAPDDRLFSLSPDVGLAVSSDGSCTWRRSGGPLASQVAVDYFPDPTDPTRVLAIASTDPDDGGVLSSSLYLSTDGGVTFADQPLVTVDDVTLIGVESARSDPNTVYLAGYRPGLHPLLMRSANRGKDWETLDLQPMLGASTYRIVAVDPADAKVVYLRVIASGGDVLAVTRDGGATFTKPVTVAGGALTGFARLQSGTVLVAGLLNSASGATTGVTWRSGDGGRTFQDWALDPQPHLRALAERGGKLYLAGKNYSDGWAIAVSTDEGRTLQPLATYDAVSTIKACARQVCQDNCDYQAGLKIFMPQVCNPPPDAGAGGGGGSGGGGCGCGTAGPTVARRAAVTVVALLLATVALALARRPRRSKLRPPS